MYSFSASLEAVVNTFLNAEQESLLENYRAFVAEFVQPVAPELEKQAGSPGGLSALKELLGTLGSKGYLGIGCSTEYGGKGGKFVDLALFSEALGEVDPGLALTFAAHTAALELIDKFGTETQKSRYLPLLARGEVVGAVAIAEENAGSDFRAQTTEVGIDGDSVVLSGRKTWVVNGDLAQLAVVSGKFKDKLVLCLVDLAENAGAIKPGSHRDKLGLRSARTCDIEFASLELGEASILGYQKPGDLESAVDLDESTASMIDFAHNVTKTLVASSAVGLLEAAVKLSVGRANSRQQFGAAIGRLQAIQWKLADLSAESSAARLLTLRAAWSKDEAPEEFPRHAAMCKFYAARTARVHSSEAVQIFGSLGISAEEPVEKLYRDAKVMEICEGTSEIQKNIIASEVGA